MPMICRWGCICLPYLRPAAHGAHTRVPHLVEAVVLLQRQQAQRRAVHACLRALQRLHRVVRLAAVGWACIGTHKYELS